MEKHAYESGAHSALTYGKCVFYQPIKPANSDTCSKSSSSGIQCVQQNSGPPNLLASKIDMINDEAVGRDCGCIDNIFRVQMRA
jgi:hypothetical protein